MWVRYSPSCHAVNWPAVPFLACFGSAFGNSWAGQTKHTQELKERFVAIPKKSWNDPKAARRQILLSHIKDHGKRISCSGLRFTQFKGKQKKACVFCVWSVQNLLYKYVEAPARENWNHLLFSGNCATGVLDFASICPSENIQPSNLSMRRRLTSHWGVCAFELRPWSFKSWILKASKINAYVYRLILLLINNMWSYTVVLHIMYLLHLTPSHSVFAPWAMTCRCPCWQIFEQYWLSHIVDWRIEWW